MNLAQFQTRLNSDAGFDLTDSEATDRLNQAQGRLALRSRYPRKIATIGETVAEQAAYDWPTDLLLPLRLAVAEAPWEMASQATARQYRRGELVLQAEGTWYDAPGEDGTRKLYLYPTPSAAHPIELEWVYEPGALVTASDEPSWLPGPFHKALLYEVASDYYETVEDNPELGQRNSERVDALVAELWRYENMRRAGSGVFIPAIVGYSA